MKLIQYLDDWAESALAILRRAEFLYKNVPQCPHCQSEFVRIIRHKAPAEWRCMNCRHQFHHEPRET